jgi:hypothetical protein
MAGNLATVPPPASGVFRLAYGPADPFAPPDWGRADDDGTFGNRFDDPSADDGKGPGERFRTIYCATQREAAFGETLARFRPSLSLLAQLQAVHDDEPLEESLRGVIDPQDPRRGLISADWRLRRRIGHTVLDPELAFVDLTNPETMQHLRLALATLVHRLGVTDVDLSSLTSPQRRLTQGIARYIHDVTGPEGQRLAGIRYPSRLNGDWECWAVFDDRILHAPGCPGFPATILADDEDLLRVAQLFGLTIEVLAGLDQYIRP